MTGGTVLLTGFIHIHTKATDSSVRLRASEACSGEGGGSFVHTPELKALHPNKHFCFHI